MGAYTVPFYGKSGRSMRLDFKRFTRERYAGIILAAVILAAVILSYALTLHLEDVKRYYLGGIGDIYAIQNPLQFDRLLKEYTVVAVMFESPTCPHCRRLYPYWHQVEIAAPLLSQQLGVNVSVNHVMYSSATDPIFRRYHIEETPTLILFVNGKPVSIKGYADFGPEFVRDPVEAIKEWIVSTAERALQSSSNTSLSSRASMYRGEALAASAGLLAAVLMLASALAAGVLSAFSPCVLPLLITYISSTATLAKRLNTSTCTLCGLAAAAGGVAIALVFVVAGSIASVIQDVLMPAIAATVLALGIALLLGVPMEVGTAKIARKGLLGFCGIYGLLSLQCTLPLVAGALLLALGAGNLLLGAGVALAFGIGLGASLAAVLYATSRAGTALANKLLAKSDLLNRIGGAVMIAAGLYLLLYVNGLV